jgi:predicted transcriptional regulator
MRSRLLWGRKHQFDLPPATAAIRLCGRTNRARRAPKPPNTANTRRPEFDGGLKAAFAYATVCTTLSYRLGMTTLTIRLDEELERALDRLARTTGRSKSELAREALKRHLAVARFRELRRRTLPFAEAQGLLTDEEIFKAVS